MKNIFKNWKGSIIVNNKKYNSVDNVDFNTIKGSFSIVLKPDTAKAVYEHGNKVTNNTNYESNNNSVQNTENVIQYRIKVRQYMTKPASPDFDFQAKWNNNNPMPMRVMVGTKEKETRGMVYMKLHGDITERIIPCCMKCGRQIPNKISQFFGMGPECGGHNYVNPFKNDEELQNAVKDMKAKLNNIVWEGWIIKSAIEEEIQL